MLNPQRMWEQVDVLQAIWNLRDRFKSSGAMLVLLTTPGAILPSEIRNDVMVLDEPLPSGVSAGPLCPITINGCIRVLSHANIQQFALIGRIPAQVCDLEVETNRG